MDLSFLDKSSGVTPLLVRLYDSHKMYSIAKDKKPLARAELTSAVSDLLGMELSVRERELIADVLIGLMRQAEKDLRQALAERLSVIDNAPLRVILQISNDEIDIAGPILRNSNVLGDLDLLYIIKSKGPGYWREIAARKAMSDHVINILADTRDFDTAVTLAENMNIHLTEHCLSVLSDMAQGKEDLATPLLRRDEITAEIAGKLYQHVGQELQHYILSHYEIDTNILIDTIDDIVLELTDEGNEENLIPNAAVMRSVDRFHDKGLLTMRMMLSTLKRGQTRTFIGMMAKFTALSPETILSIIRQPSGQGLAVVCKAFEVVKPDFVSMYLLSNKIRNKNKMADLKEIARAIRYFERIEPSVARGIMKNSIHSLKD